MAQVTLEERNQLFDQHGGLPVYIARSISVHLPTHVDLDDLIQAGRIGLLDAIDRYDPARGVELATYAKFRIRGAIIDHLRSMDFISRYGRAQQKRAEIAWDELCQELQREPTPEEMAERLGLSQSEYSRLSEDIARMAAPIERDGLKVEKGRPTYEVVDPAFTPDELAHRSERDHRLRKAVQTLPPRWQKAVSTYFFEGRTMRETGEQLGVNESRVSQIIQDSLRRLRLVMSA